MLLYKDVYPYGHIVYVGLLRKDITANPPGLISQ